MGRLGGAEREVAPMINLDEDTSGKKKRRIRLNRIDIEKKQGGKLKKWKLK